MGSATCARCVGRQAVLLPQELADPVRAVAGDCIRGAVKFPRGKEVEPSGR